MNDEIEFGEVEQAAPNRALRPDENRHFAVVAWGEPKDGDLTIYVDLDVMADMEDHALSDTAVELARTEGVSIEFVHAQSEDDIFGDDLQMLTGQFHAEHKQGHAT